jgi:uncharacterized SAM-binding protein YcdF (DUF218 family)
VLRRLLIALGMLAGLWLLAVALLFVWPRANDSPPAHADVVVVLSGGRDSRLDPALTLMRRGIAPVLAISSAGRDPKWMKARLLCNGKYRVRFRVVCFAANPYSTRGEAETVTRLAHARGWHRIIVVTSTYHVTRALMLFRRCFHGQLWTVGTRSPWYRLPEEWATETAKLLVQTFYERAC